MPCMSLSGDESSPYVELDRAAWAALAPAADNPLTRRGGRAAARSRRRPRPGRGASRSTCRSPGCSTCTSTAPGGCTARWRPSCTAGTAPRTPFVIGVAGSVAVGKSTTARMLPAAAGPLARAPAGRAGDHRRLPAAQRRAGATRPDGAQGLPGVLRPAGAAAVRRRHQVRQRRGRGAAYSHLVYDIVPDEQVVVKRPDILIVEGLNVLQPARVREDGRTSLAVSDFFDFTVYVDAGTDDIRRWYVERFLRLRETAFRDPGSYFRGTPRSRDERGRRPRRADLGHHQRAQPRRRTCCPPGAGPPWSCARTPTTGPLASGSASSEPGVRAASEGELAAHDLGKPVGDRRRPRSPARRPRPSPGPAARCRRGAAAPGPGRRAAPRPRRPRRPAPRRRRRAALSTPLTLTSTCGSRVITAARSASVRPVAAIRCSRCSAVSVPSPVVAWSQRMTWPDCSPPSA